MKRKKLPEREEIHENQSRKTKSFSKSLSPGQNWKSKSMRIIPEEILGSTPEGFEHRVVFTVPWNNSWQLWLQRDKNSLFMIKEDWDEFVDDNLLGSDHTLLFTHQDTMYFQVQIFKKDGKEIISAPLRVEPEPEPVLPKPHNSHQETSASGRGRQSFAHVENPERYLFNPQNPYFEKTLTKTNTLLYVSPVVIKKYDLEFGPHSSSMYFLLPDGNKLEGFTKSYGGVHAFLGWAAVCQKYKLKQGDTVVCEFELSGGRVVTAVRVHFVTASNSVSGRQSFGHVVNPERYLLNPNNPYFEKTLTKTNNVLYVSPVVIEKYSLEFGPHSSSMYFLLPDGSKLEGFTKSYCGVHAFLGWAAVCQKYNLKQGDTVVCELELSGRVVTAVRVHLVNE